MSYLCAPGQDEPLVAPSQYLEPTSQSINPQTPVDTNFNLSKTYLSGDDLEKSQVNDHDLDYFRVGYEVRRLKLYTFIWIIGTAIFLMFGNTTGSKLFFDWFHIPETNYDHTKFSFSVTLLYIHVFVIPMAMSLGMKYYHKFPYKILPSKIMSISGYTNFLWFPVVLIRLMFVKNNFYEQLYSFLLGFVIALRNMQIFTLVNKNYLLLHNGDVDASKTRTFIFYIGWGCVHMIISTLAKFYFIGI